MKGILGENLLLISFSAMLFATIISNCVLLVINDLKENKATDEQRKEKANTFIDILKGTIQILVILFFYIGVLWFAAYQKIRLVMIVFMIMACLFSVITFVGAITDFVQYVFVKRAYRLSLGDQRSIIFTGLITLIFCYSLTTNDMAIWIGEEFSSKNVFIMDVVRILFLIIWYFSTMFFNVVLLVITIHNAVAIFKHIRRRKGKKINIKFIEFKFISLSNDTLISMKNVRGLNFIIYIGKCIIWLLVSIFEAVLNAIFNFADFLLKMLAVVILYPCMVVFKILKQIIYICGKQYERVIVYVSRFSLVLSLVIVYFVDSYEHILSNSGSQVYEFLCSVIIIPFLITQITELRMNSNNKENAKLPNN